MPKMDLKEGVDFYYEDGLVVFTGVYLLERGYCCGSKCRHCPYPVEAQSEAIRRRLLGRPITSPEEMRKLLESLPMSCGD